MGNIPPHCTHTLLTLFECINDNLSFVKPIKHQPLLSEPENNI